MSSPLGKYVTVDIWNPEAQAICDYSQLPCMHKDLVKQMEWRGQALVWTGFWVNKRFADIPNEQGRAPIVIPDPVPVDHPRPPFNQLMTWSNNPLPIWSENTYFAFASLYDVTSGIQAMTADQRIESLQNYYWGGA